MAYLRLLSRKRLNWWFLIGVTTSYYSLKHTRNWPSYTLCVYYYIHGADVGNYVMCILIIIVDSNNQGCTPLTCNINGEIFKRGSENKM